MKTLVCALFLVYLFNINVFSVSALRCYSCSSLTGYKYNCEVKVNNQTTATTYCTTGYTACMSLTINSTITRGCAVSNVCQLYRNSTGFRHCSTCVTDLCNGGSTIATSLGLPLGLLVIVYVVTKMT